MGIQLKNNNGGNEKNSSFRNRSGGSSYDQRDSSYGYKEQLSVEEEKAKIEAERRVQEKKMDQTEALIAAIRAQVEKEKAAKEAANKKEAEKMATQKSSSNGNSKPQFRTISPEEMAKLEEKKRLKAAGIQPQSEEKKTEASGVTGGLGGLNNGPTLSNPNGDGPTLDNPNAGKESLISSGMKGTGLGIEIIEPSKKENTGEADENTVALNVDEINAAVEKSKKNGNHSDSVFSASGQEETVKTVGGSGTVILNEENIYPSQEEEESGESDDDFISVIPVQKQPTEKNDVQSAYNIDFDDDDDFMMFDSSATEEESGHMAEEEARRKAEEEARRKAEEEARRKAEEEARRKAEEEARRKAEEEARRKAEEEARQKAEALIRQEEEKIRAEEEARRKAEEEALKYKKMAEEAARQIEETKKALEAAQKAEASAIVKDEADGEFVLPVGAEQFLGKYLTVNAISDQIIKTMKYISENPSMPRNIVILGQYGFGTTTIAEDFARSYYAMGICKNKTIAKIKAGALNRANISDAIGKLQGGCLVVENAGVLTNEKLDELYQIVSNPNNDVVIIMTGQIETLSKIFKNNVVISSQFKHLIQVHRITDMDVFAIAKNHAAKLGYPCEPGAENQLRRRMQEVESGNLDRVLKFVDNAVSKAHNREMTTGEQEHHLVSSDFE